jgi:hypothetical protein
MASGTWTLAALVAEAGFTCATCGTADCARSHGRRYRKRVRDLSTGDVFEDLPILRVRFCSGATPSLMPAELWRGRSTLSSVVETVVHVFREGVEAAHEWTGFAGTGESVVSRRTLRRWRELMRTRLIGSALSWLGPRLGLHGSDSVPPADQLDALLDRLTGTVLLAFRAATGRAALDRHSGSRVDAAARSAARRVAGRQAPTPPHDPPPARRPRGAWLPPNRRGPPRPAHGKEDRRS